MQRNHKNCQFCCQPIEEEAMLCNYCGEEQLVQSLLEEKGFYIYAWGFSGIIASLLIPFAGFMLLLQQGTIAFGIIKMIVLALAAPIVICPLTQILKKHLEDMAEQSNWSFLKSKVVTQSPAEVRQRLRHNAKQFIIANIVVFIFAVATTWLMWSAHLSRPTFHDFETFIAEEFDLPPTSILTQTDLFLLSIHAVEISEMDRRVYLGYYGRFTPYLNLNFSDEESEIITDAKMRVLTKVRESQ